MAEENPRQPGLGDQASIKLVNMVYDTPDEKYEELTEIPRRAVLLLSIMETKEQATNKERIKKHIPLSKVWRISYYKHMRSVGRKHLVLANSLAQGQVTSGGQETIGEELDW